MIINYSFVNFTSLIMRYKDYIIRVNFLINDFFESKKATVMYYFLCCKNLNMKEK